MIDRDVVPILPLNLLISVVLKSGCLRLNRSELDRELVFEIVVIVVIIVSGHLVAP